MAWIGPESDLEAGIVMQETNVATIVGAGPQFAEAAAVNRAAERVMSLPAGGEG